MPRPNAVPSLPDSSWLRDFRRKLRAWYARHARDLPWRRTGDPYAVWVSEIMLQQTQVATVKSYFERFMKRFPTIATLAGAEEQDVLRHWEGLGYYRRARQLHQAAKVLFEEHGGAFPRDPRVVRRLPGIGRYTAGAILSIAFDAREPILEANTVRLFSRLLAYRGDPAASQGNRLLWAMAEAALPPRQTGRFNQALMELGATVCVARAPRCEQCPVMLLCRARQENLQGAIPRPKERRPLEERHEVAVLVRRNGRVLVWRYAEGQRWAGLWDLPRFLVSSDDPVSLQRELPQLLDEQTGVTARLGRRLRTLKHGVTRFRITLDCYEATCVATRSGQPGANETRWVKPDELARYPLSATGRQLSRLAGGGDGAMG